MRAGDVERADDRAQGQAREVGGDGVRGVGVDDGLDSGAGAQHLGVQRQLVRDRVAVVELARRARLAVEGDEPDVLRGREREPALVRAAAAHEQPVGRDAQADVPEDAGGEAAVREHPARRGDELARHPCVAHPRAPIPPSGWATSPVMPRARSEARKT